MKHPYLAIVQSYAALVQSETDTPVFIAPSEVKSERFHIELSLLPHPIIVGNGRTRFRIRATVFAEIPPSEPAIDDALFRSLRLAFFFSDARGFPIADAVAGKPPLYALAYHSSLRSDDDLFTDLRQDERSYSYNESWLCELEFDASLYPR